MEYLLIFKRFKPKAFLFLYIFFVIIYILEVPGHSQSAAEVPLSKVPNPKMLI